MAVQPSIIGILGVLIGLVIALTAGQAGLLGKTVTVTTSSIVTQPVTTTLTETWTLRDTVTTTFTKPVTITTTTTQTTTVTSTTTSTTVSTTTVTQSETVTDTITTTETITERVTDTVTQVLETTITETDTVYRTVTTAITRTVTDIITETVPVWVAYGVLYDFSGEEPWRANTYFADVVYLSEGDILRVIVEASGTVYIAVVHLYDYPEFIYGEATPLAEKTGSRVVLEYQAAFSGYYVIYYGNPNDFDIVLYRNTIEVLPP